jgi:transposase
MSPAKFVRSADKFSGAGKDSAFLLPAVVIPTLWGHSSLTQPGKREGNKDDEKDAWDLAERLRTKSIRRQVFKSSQQFGSLRAAARAYRLITRDVVRAKNRLRSLFNGRGLIEAQEELYQGKTRALWVEKLPASQQIQGIVFGEALDGLLAAQAKVLEVLQQEAKKNDAIRLLMTIPGIGLLRAAQIVAIVVMPFRFPSRSKFWKYCGFSIVMTVSAEWAWREGRRSPDRQCRPPTPGWSRAPLASARPPPGLRKHPSCHKTCRSSAKI